MAAKGNAVIGQSGGPTSVINQSLVGVIREVKTTGIVDKLLGAEPNAEWQKHYLSGALPTIFRSAFLGL